MSKAPQLSEKPKHLATEAYPGEIKDLYDRLQVAHEERDRYKAALAYLADPKSWGGEPDALGTILYGHDTPYELAKRTLEGEQA